MSVQVESLCESALHYASMGFKVFPLRDMGKHPRAGTRGFKDATTDEETIRRWWDAAPNANIGLATEGLLVIDMDRGSTYLEADQDRLFSLNSGAHQATANGGNHVFFKQPEGKNWRCNTKKLGDKVDVRADGGYVVVAPSRLDEDRVYEWVPFHELVSVENLSEPPEWLVENMDAVNKRSTVEESKAGEPILDGDRNDTLFSRACAFRRLSVSEAGLLGLLLAENAERCKPPLPESEVRKIVHQAAKYPVDQIATIATEGNLPLDFFSYVRSFDELHAEIPAFLVESVLYDRTLTFLAGDPKAGKSTLAIQIAIGVLTGKAVLGKNVTRKGRVAILENDMSEGYFGHVVKAIVQGSGGALEERLENTLYFQCSRGLNLRDQGHRKRVKEAVAEIAPALLIVDCLRGVHDGDENDSQELSPVLDALLDLRDLSQGAVLVIDHVQKPARSETREASGYELRGSGAKFARADSVLILHSKGDGTSELSGEHRTGPRSGKIALRFADEEETGKGICLVVVEPDGTPVERVEAFLKAAGIAQSMHSIRRNAVSNWQAAQVAVEELVSQKKIERLEVGKRVLWRALP